MPIRMALIAAILKLKQGILAEEPPHRLHPVYRERTLPCPNPQCVTCQESEQRYLWPRFWIVPVANSVLLLRWYAGASPAALAAAYQRRPKRD